MKRRNPVAEIPEIGYIEVYRIQNSKGVGPYQDKNSPIQKIFNKVTMSGAISSALLNPKLDPVLFALLDGLARTKNTTGEIFRCNPKDDSFDPSDLTFMRKQKALTGFLNLEQVFSWFRSPQELQWLADCGYSLYKIKTHNVRFAKHQCLFIPDELGTEVTSFKGPEAKLYSKYIIDDLKEFIMESLALNER